MLKNNYEPDQGNNDINAGKRNKAKNKKPKSKDKARALNHKTKSTPAMPIAHQPQAQSNGHIKVPQQNGIHGNGRVGHNDKGVAKELYREVPETSCTRSISNPEAVMRRRRQQKIESKKLP